MTQPDLDTDELRRLLAKATAQNSVVCLRRYAEKWSGLHKDIAVDFANGADALDALPALLDRLEAAEKALEPFASVGRNCEGEPDDTVLYTHQCLMSDLRLNIGHFRIARAALNKESPHA